MSQTEADIPVISPAVSPTDSPAALQAAALRPLADRMRRALDAMREGRPVVVLDDDDRENEADLIVAAECLTPANMAMLIRECSGIVCLCLTREKVRQLGLRPMVEHNRSRYGTAFTVSIEAREGVSTGVSAADRITTIRAAIAPEAGPDAVVSPGHVFPLVAVDGGVLARRGHTEGAVELARMAGLSPAAVLCELMNPDGSMARRAEALAFAEMYRLPVLTIADLVAWRSVHG